MSRNTASQSWRSSQQHSSPFLFSVLFCLSSCWPLHLLSFLLVGKKNVPGSLLVFGRLLCVFFLLSSLSFSPQNGLTPLILFSGQTLGLCRPKVETQRVRDQLIARSRNESEKGPIGWCAGFVLAEHSAVLCFPPSSSTKHNTNQNTARGWPRPFSPLSFSFWPR